MSHDASVYDAIPDVEERELQTIINRFEINNSRLKELRSQLENIVSRFDVPSPVSTDCEKVNDPSPGHLQRLDWLNSEYNETSDSISDLIQRLERIG